MSYEFGNRKFKRILVTGGAGFIGSHLVDRLMKDGHEVICLDNFFTGRKENVSHHIGNPRFELIRHDIVNPIFIEGIDQIFHLACPASPVHYQYNPIKTVKTNVIGTTNMLGLAKRINARILITSTSEVYGDPTEHPQKEEYWGNVNCIGERACYDEGKRVAETLMFCYKRQNNVDIRVARVFNTYGPRMIENDGRVVSNFCVQALKNEPITIYGTGDQTRSFCYVDDLVEGLIRLMNSNDSSPVNLGNDSEFTIMELAKLTLELLPESRSSIVHKELPSDDPTKRKPDLTKARGIFDYKTTVPLKEGLKRTIDYFSERSKDW